MCKAAARSALSDETRHALLLAAALPEHLENSNDIIENENVENEIVENENENNKNISESTEVANCNNDNDISGTDEREQLLAGVQLRALATFGGDARLADAWPRALASAVRHDALDSANAQNVGALALTVGVRDEAGARALLLAGASPNGPGVVSRSAQ